MGDGCEWVVEKGGSLAQNVATNISSPPQGGGREIDARLERRSFNCEQFRNECDYARNINTQVERGFWVVIVALITHGNMYLLLSAGNADTWELT